MSTTPTIIEKAVPYTVVGGSKQPKALPELTILLLNRGGRFYREELLTEISACPAWEIICIEGPELSYDLEPLSHKFPDVRFLLLGEEVSTGEKINLGFSEARCEYVLVMWSDMKFVRGLLPGCSTGKWVPERLLCTVPLFRNHKKELVPTIQVPGFIKRRLKVIPWKSERAGIATLFPFDYSGIYSRELFGKIGGYDPLIPHPYWQKLDFGFRAWLWGEKIVLQPALAMVYTIDVATEDNTPDASYKRFYLKNLSVVQQNKGGVLKWHKFFPYMIHSDTGPFHSLSEFLTVRKWVRQHRENFRSSVKSAIQGWEAPE